MIRTEISKPKILLAAWDQANYLWDKGHLFNDVWYTEANQKEQIKDQQEYARLCCEYLIPNRMVEPHCVAYDLPVDCSCYYCSLLQGV